MMRDVMWGEMKALEEEGIILKCLCKGEDI
jgi:hypothetical protein